MCSAIASRTKVPRMSESVPMATAAMVLRQLPYQQRKLQNSHRGGSNADGESRLSEPFDERDFVHDCILRW